MKFAALAISVIALAAVIWITTMAAPAQALLS